MTVKDFWIPCTFETRKSMLLDRLLFIPEYYDDHASFEMPDWADLEMFGNDNPVSLEYCSGNGQWIIEKALNEPQKNWIALEKRFERARKIWNKLQKAHIPNLYIVFGAAEDFTKYYAKDNSIDESYMNFPDPWPKTKHAKNRIVQSSFVTELSRILKPQARATFVTDNVKYSQQIISTFQKNSDWKSAFAEPFFTHEWPEFGTSYFDQLWRDMGLQIRYHQFLNLKTL